MVVERGRLGARVQRDARVHRGGRISLPSWFDRGVKKDRYAATGCRELWLVDLDTDEIEQYLVSDGVAVAPSVHRRGGDFSSDLLGGATFSVDDRLCLGD